MAYELRVRIDWGNDGTFSRPAATSGSLNPSSARLNDVSDHVISVRYSRGKSSITRGFAAGQAVIELTNDDGLYSPWNRYSILVGDGSELVPDQQSGQPWLAYLRPQREVRIDILNAHTVYRRFTGWIDRMITRTSPGGDKTCVIYASDAMKQMERIKFSLAMQANVAVDTLIGTILNQARILKYSPNLWFTFDMQGAWNGFDNAPLFNEELAFIARSIDSISDIIPYAWWDRSTLKAALDEIVSAYGASYFVDGDGTVVVHSRYHEYTAARSIGAGSKGSGTWAAQQTLGAEMFSEEQEISIDDLRNIAQVQSQAYKPQGSPSTLWSLQDQQVPIRMEPGEYIPLHVAYTGPASAVTTPVATTDYTASANEDGSGADKTGNLAPNFVAYGASADFNLQNTDTGVIWVQTLKIRGTVMDAQLAIIDERLHDGSIAEFRQMEPEQVSSKLVQDRGLAGSLATQIVLTRGPSRATPKVTFANDPAMTVDAQLGDSVEVRYDDGNWDPWLGDPEDAPNRYGRYHLAAIQDTIRPKAAEGIDVVSTWFLTESLVQAGGRDFFRFDVGPGFDRGILIW